MPVAIDKPSKYFNSVGYTGNSSTQSITGVGFKPDLVWIKDRIGATSVYSHYLFDGVRGATKYIKSNSTDAEATGATYLTSFDTDGFSLGSYAGVNASGDTTISWNWLGANTTVSNTSGTITSTVSANTTSGFSIVSYTGSGSAATVGHGLGVAPKIVIIKNRNSATNWSFYSKALVDKTGNSASDLILNGTNADLTDASYFNSTAPTSTVFSIGSNSGVTGSGNSIIAYCFAEVKGYSKFSSYTGNGSTDGTFVYTGFKPAFVMIKTTSAAESWNIGDNKRNITYPAGANVNNAELYANLSNAETDRSTRGGGVTQFDMLSNGFKCRGANPDINYSGYNYIYMAFAENPFCSSKGIPTTAR